MRYDKEKKIMMRLIQNTKQIWDTYNKQKNNMIKIKRL